MKKICLLAMFGLLFTGCNSGTSYPSNPETVLRKGIEALNEKNLKDVNRYFDLQDWNEVLQCKEGMNDQDEKSFWLISEKGYFYQQLGGYFLILGGNIE